MNKKQLKRMLELSDIKKTPINEGRLNTSTIELIKKAANGKTYVIVRENRTYYIKLTDTKQTLTESDFDFIGGVQNKTKNSFKSYDDAVSRLNIMFNDINRVHNINENVNMVNFDYRFDNGVYVILENDDYQKKYEMAKKLKPGDLVKGKDGVIYKFRQSYNGGVLLKILNSMSMLMDQLKIEFNLWMKVNHYKKKDLY